ncbi:MAG: hypothetical protein OXP37_02750 [Chloroflexota bacterium]|nr:hypothetical protein [Chloroflexota bacterium]MDE2935739.1 hypothetical protein [Chloroflexota bacterium]
MPRLHPSPGCPDPSLNAHRPWVGHLSAVQNRSSLALEDIYECGTLATQHRAPVLDFMAVQFALPPSLGATLDREFDRLVGKTNRTRDPGRRRV